MPGPVFESGDRVALHTIEEDDLDLFARDGDVSLRTAEEDDLGPTAESELLAKLLR